MKHLINALLFSVICLMPYPAYAFEKVIAWDVEIGGYHYAYTALLPDTDMPQLPAGKCATMDKTYRTYLEGLETWDQVKLVSVISNAEKIAAMSNQEFDNAVTPVAKMTPKSAALFFYSCDESKMQMVYKGLIHSRVAPIVPHEDTPPMEHYSKNTYTITFVEQDGAIKFSGSSSNTDSKLDMPESWL